MSQWLILERLENNDLELPKYATDYAAGVDFAACLTRPGFVYVDDHNDSVKFPMEASTIIEFEPHQTRMIPLGFKCEFGERYVLTMHVRSSIGLKGFILANGTGIIDPDYRGELFACMFNKTNHKRTIKHGQRIVQGVLLKFERPVITEREVGDTKRGEKGFGSSGE